MKTSESRSSGRRVDGTAFAIILSVAAVLAYVYYRQVDRPYFADRLALHRQIMDGSAESPYRYRVLAPFIGEALRRAFRVALPADGAFLLAYALYDLAAIAFTLGMLFTYLRTWFSKERSLVGVLFAAATMPVALRDHGFQPWSLLEAGFLSAGLLYIHQKRYRSLALIVAAASLNRETAIFIPLAFLFAGIGAGKDAGPLAPPVPKAALIFALLSALWAAVFFGLRYVLGSAPPVETIGGLFARNMIPGALIRAALRAGLIFGALWIFAIAGFRSAPAFARRVAAIVPLYLCAIILWGVWGEVRLLMPLYPVVIPLALSFVFRDRGAAPDEVG